ncbi:FAD/NAD(P)-binding protein [Micrococcus terreus]|uniref:FAD/NAD(P)-binding protein n=1 Tax=Micrococcus terreus TaxID=574650 RepID=UPI003D741AFB
MPGSATAVPARPVTVAVVGAGPRGTSFLERLLAHLEHGSPEPAGIELRIVVLDPDEPGPGHVWRTDQSPLLLMNTPSFFPTAAPTGDEGLVTSSVGGSFEEWRQTHPRDSAGLGRNDYPPRAMYGRYLAELYAKVTQALEACDVVGKVEWIRAEVTGLEEAQDGRWRLDWAGGEFTADSVVLAVGHVPARPTREQDRLATVGGQLGLHYREPNIPCDLDDDSVPAGADVLVRGMGLNFFDALAQFTLGRGGAFEHSGEGPGRALRYRPSGEEPVLHPCSRRGTPYFPKAELDSFVPHGVSLKYFVAPVVQELERAHGPLDFGVHLWPLIHRDVIRAYYHHLVRTRPEALGGVERAAEFFSGLVGLLEAAGRGEPVTARQAQELLHRYAPGMPFFDIRALGRPFAERVFTSGEEYQHAVQDLLEGICGEAAQGEDSPLMVAVGTLHAARLLVKRLVAEGRITDASRLRDVMGWFETLVEGLASGPPLLRVEQLLAVARAGLVRFAGPDPQVEVDQERGQFTVSSPQVGGGEEPQDVQRGSWLIEAMMPANRVQRSASALVAGMLSSGLATPYLAEDEEGGQIPGRGFAVTERPYQLVSAEGQVRTGVYVLGLQLASVQWGTAIAAETGQDPDGRAMTLGDADAAARDVLRRAATPR